MYALALDESGTHNGAPVLLIAGLAVHEADIRPFERALHSVLNSHLSPLGLNPYEYELHAKELKTPSKARASRIGYPGTRNSEWLTVASKVRMAILEDVYNTIRDYQPADRAFPLRVFGAVVDRRHKQFQTAEKTAYDHVLHRFDEMLQDMSAAPAPPQRGLILHDRRGGHERGIQDWAALWQRTGARLDGILQVPVFTDSRASRLIQAADFVSYGLWRHYSCTPADSNYSADLWAHVARGQRGELSGVIHVSPDFKAKVCTCPPCQSRY